MRDEFVRRRAWLDDATFLGLLGAANLIPGPTSTELAMHIGHRRAGRAGLGRRGPGVPAAGRPDRRGPRLALRRFRPAPADRGAAGRDRAGRRRDDRSCRVVDRPDGVRRTPWHGVLLVAAIGAVLGGFPEIAVLLAAGLLGLIAGSVARPGCGGSGSPCRSRRRPRGPLRRGRRGRGRPRPRRSSSRS